MPTIIVFQRHSPENCVWLNEKIRKTDWYGKASGIDPALEKHGIKRVGSWYVEPEHLGIYVYEAPSYDAFLKFQMDPEIAEWVAHHTYEIKVAYSGAEYRKLLE